MQIKKKKQGEEAEEPLYTDDDVVTALSQFKVVDYGKEFNICPEVSVCFTDAGHIVGSAAVHLNIKEDSESTRVTFSGDVGRYGDLLLKSPQTFSQAGSLYYHGVYLW
ncbi:hypothetical protein [Pedobacter sp. NJ-S-72]